MDEQKRLEVKEEAFIGILINMNLSDKEVATIATALNTEDQMDEMYNFLKKRDFKATKQEIWNETGRIIKKHK